MVTAIIFIIILGVLIFVHELGHFLTARRNGIKAYEFGFGFPPRIIGFQRLTGKKMEKVAEEKETQVQISESAATKNIEVVKEVVTEKIREIDEITPVKKWRFIFGRRDGDDEWEEKDLDEAHKNKYAGGTIYSLNLIPIGGFVKIKGENGDQKNDTDSFAGRNAWVRIKVLAAGVIMNFALAWILISLVMMIGAPELTERGADNQNKKIQIIAVASQSPAEKMGLNVGDEILKVQGIKADSIETIQKYIADHKGQEVALEVKRGNKILELKGTPRLEAPQGEGALGIQFGETVIVVYPWYEAIWRGFTTVLDLIWLMLTTLFGIITSFLFGQKVAVEVAGPVGIAVLTKQVTTLGLVYVLQFAALLSINLGIINALPIPALDGGRILFIIIEKLKGKPVAQQTEHLFHTVGFILLLGLMIFITFRDVLKFIK